MRTLFTVIPVALFAISVAAGEPQFEQEARGLVQEFVGQLKPQLKQAMAEGGPTQAIRYVPVWRRALPIRSLPNRAGS